MTHGGPVKRQKASKNSANVDDELPITPPDGGYGWVVVIASFFIHIITDGITYSFGVMYVELLKEFNEGKGYTSCILSLLCGMTLCSGPISSSFVNKYGCQAVTIAGSIIAAACLLVSYYAQNIFTLIITIGLGLGCGLGLIYLPAIVSVSAYFEKYRSIAIGIAVAGSGLGTFIFAPLVAIFIETLGWRKTLLVLSAIVLNCALFGALFRPPKSRPANSIEQSNTNEKEIECHQNNGIDYKPSTKSDTLMTRSQSVGHNMRTNNHQHNDDVRYMLSQPLLTNAGREIKPLSESRRSSSILSRPDIFYQGSLHNISNFRSQSELRNDVEKFGSLPRVEENEMESPSPPTKCWCFNSDESFLEMINFQLLSDPIFLIFVLSNFCTCLGFYVPYFCLADKAKMYGLSTEEASYILAAIGCANTIGRIVLGYISDKSWVNRLYVYNICLFSCGIATAASIFCVDFISLTIYASVFGFTIGAYVGLTSVILVDLLGLDKLTNAFGILLLFQGLASYIGPPIVGFLYDQSQSYTPGFIFAGSMIALSGFILFFIPTLQRYFARRQMRSEIKKNAQ
ncbi:monocarboxylate transporter 12-like [Contarinia nasturtii]|uniref:monocarboxylate transporter 12-like n=1 Tax=Contarinia nasturtii TaxID=265458 RepID=UPI0012D3D6DF|nr:monocarboxylate transporter 12-like [Contarinia nasturtii]